MLKKMIVSLAFSVFMFSVFTSAPSDSKAATLPQVIFSNNGMEDFIYVSVSDLGTIFGNEWEIIVFNDFPIGADPFGFGFRNYNATYGTAVQTEFRDDTWEGAAMVFNWIGDGSLNYISLSTGWQGVEVLSTTPSPPVE